MWSVLIADDELIECQALELMLRNNYKDVTVLPYANDGLACIHMAEQYEPDILLVDINMPEFNGIEAASYLKKKNFRGKIIIITAYSKFAYIQDALRAGVEDYILKPVKMEELCRVVNQIRSKNIQEEEKLTMIRLGKAIEMIENSSVPVKRIAEESGFLSTSYFYRIIKKKFDISVSRMRELCGTLF